MSLSPALPPPRASVSLCTQFWPQGCPTPLRGLLGANWGVLECRTHRCGVRAAGCSLGLSEQAATSMLGNFTLIKENKEGAGLRWGDMLGDDCPATPAG